MLYKSETNVLTFYSYFKSDKKYIIIKSVFFVVFVEIELSFKNEVFFIYKLFVLGNNCLCCSLNVDIVLIVDPTKM